MTAPDGSLSSPAAAPRVDGAGLAPDPLRRLQRERLARTLTWARRSSFWSERVPLGAASGLRDPDAPAVRALAGMPTTAKTDLIADQAAHPPYGSTLCVPPSRLAHVFGSSGTSGRRLLRVLTEADWLGAVGRISDSYESLPAGAPALVTSPADLFGPALSIGAIRARGLLPVMAGPWSTEVRARFLAAARPPAIAGVPSYLLHLAEVAEGLGIDPAEAGVRRIVAFGEPGAAFGAVHDALRERYRAERIVDGYGMTEAGPIGRGCPHGHGLHFDETEFVVECLVPGGPEPVPDGELGELVLTTLRVEGQPLVRYRTGDLVSLAAPGRCSCGSWLRRSEGMLRGRADEMIVYHGVNVFPSAVADALAREGEASTVFELVLDDRPALAALTLRVESVEALAAVAADALATRLAARVREILGVTVPTVVEPPGTLPAVLSSGKSRRVRRVP